MALEGPRFSGRGVLAVFGILGLLLTVGLMALLAVRVLDSTDPVPDLPGPDAGAAECETERATIEIGVQAYELTTGNRPADIQALVDFGVLSGSADEYSHQLGANGEVVATGGCAGG